MFKKEEIIRKLRKYAKESAKENGGKTPGEKNFHENTDVGIWDQKKYWPNYGELVREAGLKPNKFDKTKYSKEQLCNIFIKVIREKNKWPTRGFLDIKHFNDNKFPSSATFYKKLGLTGKLAQTLLEFVENKKGYSDIIKICNSVIEKHEVQDESSESGDLISGFVYLGKQHGKYKIGRTNDLNRRREDITLLGSEPIEWIHTIETDDMKGVEEYWHKRFEKKWKRGEWFSLITQDVKAFKRWKKIY